MLVSKYLERKFSLNWDTKNENLVLIGIILK